MARFQSNCNHIDIRILRQIHASNVLQRNCPEIPNSVRDLSAENVVGLKVVGTVLRNTVGCQTQVGHDRHGHGTPAAKPRNQDAKRVVATRPRLAGLTRPMTALKLFRISRLASCLGFRSRSYSPCLRSIRRGSNRSCRSATRWIAIALK